MRPTTGIYIYIRVRRDAGMWNWGEVRRETLPCFGVNKVIKRIWDICYTESRLVSSPKVSLPKDRVLQRSGVDWEDPGLSHLWVRRATYSGQGCQYDLPKAHGAWRMAHIGRIGAFASWLTPLMADGSLVALFSTPELVQLVQGWALGCCLCGHDQGKGVTPAQKHACSPGNQNKWIQI